MTTISYPHLDECIQTTVLDNGLRIYCVPRTDSAKTFAMLAADFGSIDCSFTLDGQKYDVTPGIAHFLEHKMFEEEDGNALQKFTALGAQPNAFTSHTMTAYHFTCTSRFYDCLEILLRFVTTPYFTDENVAKEKGIIGQEIGMLDDRPSWQAYVGVLEGLYAVHPVRISVAGSKQTIAPIDPEVLQVCHRGFYSPANLVLIVCGQYEFDRVVELAKRITPKESARIAARDYGQEPEQAAVPYIEKHMAVSRPLFMLGCRTASRSSPIRHSWQENWQRTVSAANPRYYMTGCISRGCLTAPLTRIILRFPVVPAPFSAGKVSIRRQYGRPLKRNCIASRKKGWMRPYSGG